MINYIETKKHIFSFEYNKKLIKKCMEKNKILFIGLEENEIHKVNKISDNELIWVCFIHRNSAIDLYEFQKNCMNLIYDFDIETYIKKSINIHDENSSFKIN